MNFVRYALSSLSLLCVLSVPGAVMANPETTERAKKFIADHETQHSAAGHRRRPGLVERQHLRQGRGLQEEGRGPEQARRGPRRQGALRRAEGDQAAQGQGRDRRQDRRPRHRRALPACTSKSRSIRSCSRRSSAKANAVEQAFNVFRAKVDGKEMTDSEVRKVLKKSNDSERRQGGLGGEQGRRRGRRGGPEGTGQAPQRGGEQARLQELSTPCSCTSTSRTATN